MIKNAERPNKSNCPICKESRELSGTSADMAGTRVYKHHAKNNNCPISQRESN